MNPVLFMYFYPVILNIFKNVMVLGWVDHWYSMK